MASSFDRFGPPEPSLPVILSVPHAGRDYPSSMAADCRFDLSRLKVLEDRFADLLVADAARRGYSGLIARTPRAYIDLNRSETDLDNGMLLASPSRSSPLSVKARGGLGLIPRRTANLGELWNRKFSEEEVRSRVDLHHAPYHDALHSLLTAARARFDTVVLIDVHSMPPLPDTANGRGAEIVIGDRFGRSADTRFGERLEHVARNWGFRTASNTPYAGGHILDRHGSRHKGVHALQIEIDRRLYLNPSLEQPSDSHEVIARLVTAIANDLASFIDGTPHLLAAE